MKRFKEFLTETEWRAGHRLHPEDQKTALNHKKNLPAHLAALQKHHDDDGWLKHTEYAVKKNGRLSDKNKSFRYSHTEL